MQITAIHKANVEAEKFRKLATALLKTEHTSQDGSFKWVDTGKLSGALRRQSMELTRALAEMRKP